MQRIQTLPAVCCFAYIHLCSGICICIYPVVHPATGTRNSRFNFHFNMTLPACCTWYVVRGTWYLVSGISYLVPSTRVLTVLHNQTKPNQTINQTPSCTPKSRRKYVGSCSSQPNVGMIYDTTRYLLHAHTFKLNTDLLQCLF